MVDLWCVVVCRRTCTGAVARPGRAGPGAPSRSSEKRSAAAAAAAGNGSVVLLVRSLRFGVVGAARAEVARHVAAVALVELLRGTPDIG